MAEAEESKGRLIVELVQLRQRIAELEKMEAMRKQSGEATVGPAEGGPGYATAESPQARAEAERMLAEAQQSKAEADKILAEAQQVKAEPNKLKLRLINCFSMPRRMPGLKPSE